MKIVNVLFGLIVAELMLLAASRLTSDLPDGEKANGQVPKDFPFSDKFEVKGFTYNQETYSGYITVREDTKSKLFYLLHSKQNGTLDDPAPLLIWLDGGPGCSMIYSNLEAVGPMEIDSYDNATGKFTYKRREFTWTDTNHMLFIESPIGTGLTVALGGDYLNNTEQTADDLHTFLVSFFEIYPKLKSSPLYIIGYSFGGHYVPAIALKLYQKRKETGINLRGIAIGNGWVDPVEQMSYYSTFAYSAGLASTKMVEKLRTKQGEAILAFINGDLGNATKFSDENLDILKEVNLHIDQYNYRKYPPDEDEISTIWAWSNAIRDQFNVPRELKYLVCNNEIYWNFSYDQAVSFRGHLEQLQGKIQIMIYSGTDDIIIPTPSTSNWLRKFRFVDSENIWKEPKQIWKYKRSTVGNVQTKGQFSYVIVYQAGHGVPEDQLEVSRDMLQKLLTNSNKWS